MSEWEDGGLTFYCTIHEEGQAYWRPENKSEEIFQVVLTFDDGHKMLDRLDEKTDQTRESPRLTDAVIDPRTVVVEFGNAVVTFGTVLGAQRLSDDTRRAKLVQSEFVLLDELKNGLAKWRQDKACFRILEWRRLVNFSNVAYFVHLVTVCRENARIGLPCFVQVVP